MSHKKTTIHIRGMHCRSCEILLERNIGKIEGVIKVKTNYKKGIGEVDSDPEIAWADIERAVGASGYSLGKEEAKLFFSRNFSDYRELAAVGMILLAAYLLLQEFGIFNFAVNTSSTPGLLGVLLVGLTAGVSTCMALIGGLVLGMSARHAEIHPEATVSQKFKPHIFFNLGRLVSYTVLGGVVGVLGSALRLSSSVIGFLTVILGFVMLFLGLKLVDIFPRLHNKNIVLPKRISRAFGLHKEAKEYSHRGAFITGALTFFVPCGFTQAMQLYAVSTGSFVQGATIMGVFALGTLPGIIGIGGLTATLKGSFARYFFKFAGLVVILLALFNISTGYRLTGIDIGSYISWGQQGSAASDSGAVRMENGKQIVEMTQGRVGYSPRDFTIKKGIPVVWRITSMNQYTCAAYIHMPGAGVSQPLTLGDNVIEFTPAKAGAMRFTCSMGMYSGNFTVVD